ncbi:MAG: ABC transporter ATP-binding protein [Bdellovibrionales bacterium]|nr:ABC transporter ATP-binding protein [Oligoflexia bacterium]
MTRHLLSLPIPYFDQVSSGSMMTRLVNDVNSLTDFFQSGFVSVLGNCASLCAIFFGLFMLNFKLGLILFFSFVPIAVICVLFSQKLRMVYEETRNRLSELNSKLADVLFGMRTVRALGIGERKYAELTSQVRKYADAQTKMVGTFALFHPTLTLGTGILLLILIALGIPMVGAHELLVGQWVAALSYVILLQQPLVEISDRWNYFLAGLTGINRIQEIMRVLPEPQSGDHASEFSSLEFRDVHFRYAQSKSEALLQVNLTIQRGDWIGIFGESGSGKSTLLQMLYGFYTATSGSIFWNGSDFKKIKLASLRSHFGVVEQFPFIFSGTIKENITLFGEYPYDEHILRKKFEGYLLIESLLALADFEVSERGNNLSMGQKQMVTFLRAYLAKPDIWILDEATAFFDADAEQEVLRALSGLVSERITVIQVAHRPEALLQMKRIIQVSQGQVRELPQSLQSTQPDLK